MARKVIDITPIVTARPNEGSLRAEWAPAIGEGHKIQAQLRAVLGKGFDVTVSYETEAQCEHCRTPWTEPADAPWNGGCCDLDAANDPERLADMRKLADEISGDSFYDGEAPRRTVAIDWPNALGDQVLSWLDAGRPAESAPALLAAAQRCSSREWVTLWSDPGPSDCSLARLPDQVLQDERPEDLASRVIHMLDDMGLLPSKAAA